MEFKLDTTSPLLSQARAVMHDIDQGRISGQAAFSKLLGLYAGAIIGDQQGFATWRAKEVEKLGATGPARVDAVRTFLKGVVGDAAAEKLNTMLVTADHVQAFEQLMAKFASQGGGSYSQAGRASPAPANEIPNYDNMSFMQRRAAQDALRRKG